MPRQRRKGSQPLARKGSELRPRPSGARGPEGRGPGHESEGDESPESEGEESEVAYESEKK